MTYYAAYLAWGSIRWKKLINCLCRVVWIVSEQENQTEGQDIKQLDDLCQVGIEDCTTVTHFLDITNH